MMIVSFERRTVHCHLKNGMPFGCSMNRFELAVCHCLDIAIVVAF